MNGLPFEKPITELEKKIEELRKFSLSQRMDVSEEIRQLEERASQIKQEIYSKLTPWQKVQIARHPNRPYFLDYVRLMMEEYVELHGDRHFGDDKALIGGLARMDGHKLLILGHQKGRDIKENLMRNFGSAHPEGYRKALRLMKMADKFAIPIVAFIDTPGAYPGVGAEERGIAESIAVNLREMVGLRVPIVVTVIGEGGSGGALGIGVGDRIVMLQNSYYSVISPEGCSAILWKDRKRSEDASASLKLTGQDLLELGVIDEIVEEPLGGAHRNPAVTAANLKQSILRHLKELYQLTQEELIAQRYEKFRDMGCYGVISQKSGLSDGGTPALPDIPPVASPSQESPPQEMGRMTETSPLDDRTMSLIPTVV